MVLYNLPENGLTDYLTDYLANKDLNTSAEKEQQTLRISVYSGRAKLHYPTVDLYNRLTTTSSVLCLGPSGSIIHWYFSP